MKTMFAHIVMLLTAIAMTIFSTTAKAQNRIKGSNNIITEERTVPTDYKAISVSQAIDVLVSNYDGDKATVSANDNLMEYVKIDLKGDVLQIYLDNSKHKSFSNINIGVRLPKNEALCNIKATSASDVTVSYPLKGNRVAADASSAAEITLEDIQAKEVVLKSTSAATINLKESTVGNMTVETSSAAKILVKTKASNIKSSATSAAELNIYTLCTNISVDGSSSADIQLAGKAKNLTANATSAADIDAEDLEVDGIADAKASSGADIEVWCNGTLNATAASGADIDWKGKAKAQISKSSGGSVSKID